MTQRKKIKEVLFLFSSSSSFLIDGKGGISPRTPRKFWTSISTPIWVTLILAKKLKRSLPVNVGFPSHRSVSDFTFFFFHCFIDGKDGISANKPPKSWTSISIHIWVIRILVKRLRRNLLGIVEYPLIRSVLFFSWVLNHSFDRALHITEFWLEVLEVVR